MRNHRKNGAKYLNIERLNNMFSKKNCIEIIYPLILLFHHGTIKNSFLVFTFERDKNRTREILSSITVRLSQHPDPGTF